MYCKHCGREIADDSKFCQHCGGKQLVEGQSKYTNEGIKVKRHIFQPPLIKKIIYVILGFIACVLCAYYPLEQNIENDAQRIIEEDSIKYREEAIHRLDSVFERTGKDNFGCILYYNMLPNYEYVPNSKRDEGITGTVLLIIFQDMQNKMEMQMKQVSCDAFDALR